MLIRNFFIVLFLLFQTQVVFCGTNDFSVSGKSKKDFFYNEGLKRFKGIGVPSNHALALQCFIAAGELGNTDACHKVGWIYECSPTVSQDIEKAILWYKKSSAMGLAKSMNNLGNIYQYKKNYRDYKKAWKWYREADDKGHLHATYQLGILAEKGRGMRHDQGLAEMYYLSAAKKGYAPAQAELGFRQQEGWSGRRNYSKAMEWYQKAAAQTNARGIYGIGLMYERGEGIEENEEKAREYYQEAADLGREHAQHALGLYYERGRGGLPKDLEKAKHFHSLAVSQNYLRAYFDLAQCYEKTGETNKSFELCYTASTQGYASAQAQLAYYYEEGAGTTQSLEKAFYWYSKAAKRGNSYGLYGVGNFFEKGTFCEKNLPKAFSYYFRSAVKGHKAAAGKAGWIIMVLTGIVCSVICLPGLVIVLIYGLLTRKSYAKNKTWTIPDAVILVLSMLGIQLIFSGLYLASTKIYNKQIQFFVILGISAVGNLLVIFLAAYFSKLRKWITSLQFCLNKIKIVRIFIWAVLALAAAFLFNLLYTKLLQLFGIEIPPDNFEKLMPDKFTPALLIWTFFTAAVVVPITEEIIFRGILYRAFRQRWAVSFSIILSSAIFALIHLEFYYFIPLMFVGAAAAYSLEKTRSIYTPILFHAVNNAASIALLIIMKKFGYI